MSVPDRPVCIIHACEMPPTKNGYLVQFNADFGPYEICAGDAYECPVGGEQIVTGWAKVVFASHIDEERFAAAQKHVALVVGGAPRNADLAVRPDFRTGARR